MNFVQQTLKSISLSPLIKENRSNRTQASKDVKLQPISNEEYAHLSSIELAERIDEFFQEDELNRYPHPIPMNRVLAIEVCKSSELQNLSEPDRKRALGLFFRSQFQTTLCSQFGAFQNHTVHLPDQSDIKWTNPVFQIRNAATRQAEVIASRISFECLMEFIYFVSNRELVPSKKSKFRKFREWICKGNHNFGWLVFYLATVKRFDEQHRTPEIHGTSYIAIDALCCQIWPRLDSELNLVNLCLNVWRPIMETLNGQEVTSCSFNASESHLFERFFDWRNLDLNSIWEEITA